METNSTSKASKTLEAPTSITLEKDMEFGGKSYKAGETILVPAGWVEYVRKAQGTK